MHLLAEAAHETEPSDVLTRIKRERIPTFFGTLILDSRGPPILLRPFCDLCGLLCDLFLFPIEARATCFIVETDI